MKYFLALACASVLFAQEPPSAPKPVPVAPAKPASPPAASAPAKAKVKTESLKYTLNWPSGLDLGEAILSSARTDTQLNFGFQMDIAVAGFSISESVDSRATPEYCSTLLYKRGVRGKRKVDERTEFNQSSMTATRTTQGGGKSELSTPACAKDALTYISFLRRELAAGRLPPSQKVFYGGAYNVALKFVGTEEIRVGEESKEVERIAATVKGPASDVTADLFFLKDADRTLVRVRLPLKVGEFTLELIR